MPRHLGGLSCCNREALDSQTDFQDEPNGPDRGRARPAGRDGISEAVNDLFAGFFGCSRADLLQREDKSRSAETGSRTERDLEEEGPELLPDGFEVIEGRDCATRGAGAERMSAADIEACKEHCRQRGYGAFIVRAGMAYFRRESAEQCRAALVRSRGATAFIDTLGPLAHEGRLSLSADQDSRVVDTGLQSDSSQASARDTPSSVSTGSSGLGSGTMQMLSGLLGKLQSPAAAAAAAPSSAAAPGGGEEEMPEVQGERGALFGGRDPMSTRPPSGWAPSGEVIDEEKEFPAETALPPLQLSAVHELAATRGLPQAQMPSPGSLPASRRGSGSSGSSPRDSARGGSPMDSMRSAGSALEMLGAMLGEEGATAGRPAAHGRGRARQSPHMAEPMALSEPAEPQLPAGVGRTASAEPRSPPALDDAPADTGATGAGNAGSRPGITWASQDDAEAAAAIAALREAGQPWAGAEELKEGAAHREPPAPAPRLESEAPPASLEPLRSEAKAETILFEEEPPDPHRAQAEQCGERLRELQEALQAVDRDLKGALPEQWGPIMGAALRRARGLDREAASAVEKLPVTAAAAPALAEQQRALHENVLKLEASAKPYMKEPPKASSHQQAEQPLTGRLTGEAPTLHARLDDLNSALQAWTAALERSKREMHGSKLDAYGSTSMQHEEVMVERASAAFEEFRVGLAAGAAASGGEGAAARRNAGLLRALVGFSQWGDRDKVQEVLRLRKAFLTDPSMDTSAVRFTCGRLFLQQVAQKEKWPTAEPLTARWRDALVRTLGPRGSADWKERASRLPAQLRAKGAEQKTLPDYGTFCLRKIRARSLRSGAAWDETNPYVVFELAGEKKQTGVVWGNSDGPEWRKKDDPSEWEEIRFDVEHLRQGPVLRVGLWDHDRYAADDPLGHAADGPGGLNLLELLAPPPPLPQPPAVPRAPQPKDGMGRALQRLGFGKSEEQEAREAEEREAMLRQHQANYDRAVRERDARHPVEVHEDGSVTCQLRPLQLVGEGAGDRGASVQFEIFYQTGAIGDPLVLQPEAEDEALMLVGQVEEQMTGYQEAFLGCNEGFFLAPADSKPDLSLDPTAQGGYGMSGGFPQISPTISDEVFKYNRLLDKLNLMTTDHRHGGPEAALLSCSGSREGGGPTQQEWTEQFAGAAEEFINLLEQIRTVERTVGSDLATRRFFAFQDELLPTVGEWSMDRRRRLRNQAFLASLEVERQRQRPRPAAPPPAKKQPGAFSTLHNRELQPIALALCGAVSIYGVAMAALIFGGGWQHQGWVMLLASIMAVVCLLTAGYLYGSRFLASLQHQGQQRGNYAILQETYLEPVTQDGRRSSQEGLLNEGTLP